MSYWSKKKYFICLHVIFFWLSSERISAKFPAGYAITPVGGDKWFFLYNLFN